MKIYSPNITGSLIVTGSVNTTDAIEVREVHLRHDSGLIRMAVDNTTGQIKTVQANRGQSVDIGNDNDFVSADPIGSGGSGAGFPFSGSAVITGSLLATAQVQSPIYFGTRETSSITVPAGTDALIIGETNATGSITLEEGATLNVVGDYSNLAKRDNDNTFNGNINVIGQVSASSYIGDGSQLSGIVTDNVENATSASFATTSSFAQTASIALNVESPFPFTGSANILGALNVDGPMTSSTLNVDGGTINLTDGVSLSSTISKLDIDVDSFKDINITTENGDITLSSTGAGSFVVSAPMQVSDISSPTGNTITFNDDINVPSIAGDGSSLTNIQSSSFASTASLSNFIANENGNALSVWKGSQAEYDGLESYDSNTIYFIV